MKKPLIINIQKFSVHDGDGIRTTVFFKGCPLSCRWCHNAESRSWNRELMFFSERCSGCGRCAAVCPEKGIAVKYRKAECRKALSQTELSARPAEGCTDFWYFQCEEHRREEMEAEELVRILRQDRQFYEDSGGGVTLSGGEAMAQDMDYMENLLVRLQSEGIPVNMDTCGEAPFERFERVLPYIHTFLYDIKAVTPELHRNTQRFQRENPGKSQEPDPCRSQSPYKSSRHSRSQRRR